MYKNKSAARSRIIVWTSVIACTAVMILSAAAASGMYRPSSDLFTSTLCRNLALLCEQSDCGLSKTQLSLIEHAQIKSIRYDDASDGKRLFSARLILCAPVGIPAAYTDNPSEYLRETADNMFNGNSEEIEIIGICGDGESDNLPVIDIETLTKIAEAAERAWQNENLTSNKSFEYALTDMIIPEPFPDRVFVEGSSLEPAYEDWLDECAAQFAAEGLKVAKDGGTSGEIDDIRAAMEQFATPYLCSVRNISLTRSEEKNGILTLSFDSLDVISTLSTAKKPSVAALNKLAGVYSDERALKVSIDVDLTEFLSGGGRLKLPFFQMIRAVTGYGSSVITPLTKIKIPDSTQVIAGKSNGQWPLEFKRAKGDGNVVIDVISIDEAGSESSVLKIFLTDGGKITVCLKKGRYRLNMAVGSTYYGSKEYFGANGIYMRDTNNIYTIPSNGLKTVLVEKQPGESMNFSDYLLSQETDPSLIDRYDF